MARFLRWLAITLSLVVAVPALLLLSGLLALQLPAVQRGLAKSIESIASEPDRRIEIGGLLVDWPLDLRIPRLQVGDSEGVWLTGDELRLSWSPLRLLAGTLAIDELVVGQARVHRLPRTAETPAEPAPAPSLPRLPVFLEVDRLSAEMVFDEPVVGERAAMRAEGRAALKPGAAHVDLRLQETGGPAAMAARIDYDEDAGWLGVHVKADEAAVALLAKVGGWPVQPLGILVAGEGPVADWRGRAEATAGSRVCVAADLRASRGTALEFSVDGGLDSDCFDDATLRTLAPEGVAFDGSFAWTGGKRLHIGQARVAGAAGRVQLRGALVGGIADDLEFSVDIEELSRLGALAGVDMNGRASVTGGVGGPLAAPEVRARVTSAAGTLGGSGWSGLDGGVTIVAAQGGHGWVVASDGRVILDMAQTPIPVGETFWRVGGAVDPQRAITRIATLQVDTGALRLAALGTVHDWGGRLALRLDARGEDLAALLEPFGLALDGRGVLGAEVAGSFAHPIVAVAGRVVDFRAEVARLRDILGPRPNFQAVAAVRAPGLPFAAALETRAGRAAAGGFWEPARSVGWLTEAADLSLAGLSGGRASAKGLLAGGPAKLAASGILDAAGLPDGAAGPLRARLVLGGADLIADPRVALRGTVLGRSLEIDGRAEIEVGDTLRVSNLLVTAGADRLSGNVAYDTGAESMSGVLNGRVTSLAKWGHFAGLSMSGAATVEARLAGQSAVIGLEAQSLTVEGIETARLSGRAELAELFDRPRGTVRLSASSLLGGELKLDEATLVAQGDLNAFEFDLRGSGERASDPSISAAGSASLVGRERSVELAALRVAYGGQTARLAGSSRMIVGGDGFVVRPTTLLVGDGRVEFEGSFTGRAVAGTARLSAVPLAVAEILRPEQEFAGQVSGEIRASGMLPSPDVTVSLSGQGLGLPRAGGRATLVDAQVEGRWSGGRANANLRAVSGDRVAAQASGSFPLVLDGTGIGIPEGPIEGRLNLDADLGRIGDLLPLVDQRFAGAIRADLRVAGTVANPSVAGLASLVNGSYEHYSSGTYLRDVSLTATAENLGGVSVVGSADDGRGGRLSVRGQVAIDPAGVAYQLSGDLVDFRAVRLDTATAQASGALRLEGNETRGMLTGSLVVGPAEIDLGERGPANVVTLDVVEVNKPGAAEGRARQEDREEGKVELPYTLALEVQAEVRRLFVRGRGLESEWRGELEARGTASDPALTGQLQAVRGRYEVFGRTFNLTKGQIGFAGEDLLDPQVALVAEAKARDILARVNVGGTVRDPKIEFNSEPPYPSDEILARLLFGKEAGRLSVAQQLQLARAAASLAGGGGGFDPIADIRGALGLDLLEIGTEEGNGGSLGPTVSAGKYLDEDTFLRLEEGSGGGRVTIERELGGGFSVETELGEQAGGGVGLNWRKDY